MQIRPHLDKLAGLELPEKVTDRSIKLVDQSAQVLAPCVVAVSHLECYRADKSKLLLDLFEFGESVHVWLRLDYLDTLLVLGKLGIGGLFWIDLVQA